MSDVDIDLPPGWTERSAMERTSESLVECQHVTDDGVTFLVSVVPQANEQAFNLRLSTVEPAPTPVRHDYPIRDYDSRGAASTAAEHLAGHISLRLQDGSISAADPETKEMWSAIRDFSDSTGYSPLRRLLELFQ